MHYIMIELIKAILVKDSSGSALLIMVKVKAHVALCHFQGPVLKECHEVIPCFHMLHREILMPFVFGSV